MGDLRLSQPDANEFDEVLRKAEEYARFAATHLFPRQMQHDGDDTYEGTLLALARMHFLFPQLDLVTESRLLITLENATLNIRELTPRTDEESKENLKKCWAVHAFAMGKIEDSKLLDKLTPFQRELVRGRFMG
jgi:hypothetical protein